MLLNPFDPLLSPLPSCPFPHPHALDASQAHHPLSLPHHVLSPLLHEHVQGPAFCLHLQYFAQVCCTIWYRQWLCVCLVKFVPCFSFFACCQQCFTLEAPVHLFFCLQVPPFNADSGARCNPILTRNDSQAAGNSNFAATYCTDTDLSGSTAEMATAG